MFQIRGEKTQRQKDSLKKNKVKFVDFCTKWIVLPYSESFSEETKYTEVKIHLFSCNQGYNKTALENPLVSSIIFSLFCMPTILPNLRLIHPLSFLYTCYIIFIMNVHTFVFYCFWCWIHLHPWKLNLDNANTCCDLLLAIMYWPER